MDESDVFVFKQLLERVGLKRAFDAVRQAEHDDYVAVQRLSLLNAINTDALLATTLSSLWREAAKLARVCKRFAAAVKRREFWMPAVHSQLRSRFPKAHPELLRYVNPFFQFPEHMWMCPGWPWWYFLHWLFDGDARLYSRSRATHTHDHNVGSETIILRYKDKEALYFRRRPDQVFTTQWYPLPSPDPGPLSIQLVKTEASPQSAWISGYNVIVCGKSVWFDGNIDHSGRIWCGPIKPVEVSAEPIDAIPLEKYGYWRLSEK